MTESITITLFTASPAAYNAGYFHINKEYGRKHPA